MLYTYILKDIAGHKQELCNYLIKLCCPLPICKETQNKAQYNTYTNLYDFLVEKIFHMLHAF